MKDSSDILSAFDLIEETPIQQETPAIQQEEMTLIFNETQAVQENIVVPAPIVEDSYVIASLGEKTHKSMLQKSYDGFLFLLKYFSTSICIFAILMIGANYSAYWNLAYSIIYAEELQQTERSLIHSVSATNIEDKSDNNNEVNTFKQISDTTEVTTTKTNSIHSMSSFTSHPSQSSVDLGIEITPYENRIVIPKIGKNIPLLDIKQKKVEGVNELNDIFMEELENGVVRYPGSAKPGEDGNAFIFGHSSNNIWESGDYNDVFALLDHVTYDDEIVVYYGQEKHTYKIKTKDVISPGDVSVLESNPEDTSTITLMTCWPIGTTLNRLVLTGELISVE